MQDSGPGTSDSRNGDEDAPIPPPSTSPPAVEVKLPSTVNTTGPPHLVALQEPQENFHKDEGGKANQLSYRVILQGELPEDLQACAVEGVIPVNVRPIFDDGELAEISVLEVVGGTESAQPGISLRSRLGGVRYRLRTVSKRLGNRGIAVILEIPNYGMVQPIKSEATMVFSKRKNKEQRLEEQARERNELLERQRAAQLLLSARASPSASGESANPPVDLSQQPGGSIKFPTSSSALNLPPQFVPAQIVRPRPRRISRDREHDSDSDASYESAGGSSHAGGASRRKKGKLTNGSSTRSSSRKNVEDRVLELEAEVNRLRASLDSHIRETEEMRGAMNLCFYQLGGGAAAGIRRSSSQNVPWEFADNSNYDSQVSVRDQLVGGLSMVSPQPTRSPFEIDNWVNGGGLNGDAALRLRRDVSSSSQVASSPRPSQTPIESTTSLIGNNGKDTSTTGATATAPGGGGGGVASTLPQPPQISTASTTEAPAATTTPSVPDTGSAAAITEPSSS